MIDLFPGESNSKRSDKQSFYKCTVTLKVPKKMFLSQLKLWILLLFARKQKNSVTAMYNNAHIKMCLNYFITCKVVPPSGDSQLSLIKV